MARSKSRRVKSSDDEILFAVIGGVIGLAVSPQMAIPGAIIGVLIAKNKR